jgi:hypothetical protein
MIIVDFETTGLLSSNPNPEAQPGIVQIGLIELDAEWRETNEQCVLINPEKAIEPDAARTHGITSQNVAGAPTLVALLPDLADIFRRHTTWVGFNNSFDRNVLWHQLLRYNWGQRFPWPSRDLDIMKVSRDVVNIAGKQDVKYPSNIRSWKSYIIIYSAPSLIWRTTRWRTARRPSAARGSWLRWDTCRVKWNCFSYNSTALNYNGVYSKCST